MIRIEVHDGGLPEAAHRWLRETEAEHNLLLSILEDLAGGSVRDDFLFATVEDGGGVVGCAFRTPPWKAGLTRMPLDAVPQVVDLFAARYESLPAVMGPPDVAQTFADHWSDRRNVAYREHMRQRIHRATRIVHLDEPPPGGLRRTSKDEFGLVADWMEAFATEARTDFFAEFVQRRFREGAFWLWDHDGPKTLVGTSGWTPQGVRIGPVYTPPAWRGRRYGSAATAALSQKVLVEGRSFCCLYTDLANPTSNTIYRRLGYEPVCDVVDFAFTD